MDCLLTGRLPQVLSQRITRWAERGRALDAARDSIVECWATRHGARHRIRAMFPCVVFSLVCGGGAAAEVAG